MIHLKGFQEKYVSQLVVRVKQEMSAREVNPDLKVQHIIFKSPTGSGKTTMLAEMLKRLKGETSMLDSKILYLWFAPRSLYSQAYDSLRVQMEDTSYNLVSIDNGVSSDDITDNAIFFANWEKMTSTANRDNPDRDIKKGDWTNVATKQGETQRNLIDTLQYVRDRGIKIVLIVDESHHAFNSPQSSRFVEEVVKPSLIIEASATPKEEPDIEVPYKDVVESGLIKSQIIINNDLGKVVNSEEASRDVLEALLTAALEKQQELDALYTESGRSINPLILVQLPSEGDTVSQLDKNSREAVEAILEDKGITYESGDLAVWLTGDEKKNLDGITNFKNKVRVLIFKQAIALGWDCPRAQILVMLKDIQSDSFKIQTLGRVLRMPEAEHYSEDALNTAYIYSDLDSIKIDPEEQDNPLFNLLKYKKSKIKDDLVDKNIVLPDSTYLSRTDYGDLRADFREYLQNSFKTTLSLPERSTAEKRHEIFADNFELDDNSLTHPVMVDEIVDKIDDLTDRAALKTENLSMSQHNIDRVFNTLLKEAILPFTGFARTRAIVYPTLRDLFKSANIDSDEMKRALACSKNNQLLIKEIFSRAIDAYQSHYQTELKARRERSEDVSDWSVPTEDLFSDKYQDVPEVKNNIYDNYYRKDRASKVEQIFERMLEARRDIVWWYKNGEGMRQYFAVPYYEATEDARTKRRCFYPDYIVLFKDGTVGIFETKTDADKKPDCDSNKHNPEKSKALQEWISKHPLVGAWGGIINRDSRLGEGDDSFQMEHGAFTHGEALKMASGGVVEHSIGEYDPMKWKEFII